MSRNWKSNPRCASNRILADANTVQFTDEMAESLSGEALHCLSPELYMIWVEEMQDMDVVITETIWS